MQKLIDFDSEYLKKIFPPLLADKTTGGNIVWATNAYLDYGYGQEDQITQSSIYGEGAIILHPRAQKSQEDQLSRTRSKAEVFTPSWLCNEMNNFADTEWFGRENVFNTLNEDHAWVVTTDKIVFPEEKTWKDYVLSRRLEITCGEAPYLVSRYDTVSGELIPELQNRIGMLDRKLRIVNENTKTESNWLNWATKAFQSSYGYEFQGDSLLIARINMFMTFIDYYKERWNKEPEDKILEDIADIISWNVWQMDGFTDTVPFGKIKEPQNEQLMLFDFEDEKEEYLTNPCIIRDWKDNKTVAYKDLKKS